MEGLNHVLIRIGEISNKIKFFQPKKVRDFQNYFFSAQAKLIKSEMNHNLKKQDFNNIHNDYSTILHNNKSTNRNNILKTNATQLKDSYSQIIKDASKKYNISESLIKAVIKQESAFNPKAVSKAGAKGLMQLMPKTAQFYGVTNVFNPKQNIFAGTKHLKGLMNHFNGSLPLSLAAYNAGANRVIKAKGIPNIRETKNYVKKVIDNYQKIKDLK